MAMANLQAWTQLNTTWTELNATLVDSQVGDWDSSQGIWNNGGLTTTIVPVNTTVPNGGYIPIDIPRIQEPGQASDFWQKMRDSVRREIEQEMKMKGISEEVKEKKETKGVDILVKGRKFRS